MSKKLLILEVISLCIVFHVAAQHVDNQTTRKFDDPAWGYLEYLPAGYNSAPDNHYPAILFFHGMGEKGNGTNEITLVAKHGPPKEIKNGHKMNFTVNGKTDTFVVISPQLPSSTWIWGESDISKVVDTVIDQYKVDPSRIYLTGLSLGTIAMSKYVAGNFSAETKIAAVFMAAGRIDSWVVNNYANKGIKTWWVHGTNDNQLSYSDALLASEQANENFPANDPLIKFTSYDGIGHDSWTRGFTTDNTYHEPNAYEWLLSHKLNLVTGYNTNNFDNKKEFKVYPNPVKGYVFLPVEKGEASLISISGETVFSGLSFHNGTLSLSETFIKTGIYSLVVYSEGNVYSTRISVIE